MKIELNKVYRHRRKAWRDDVAIPLELVESGLFGKPAVVYKSYYGAGDDCNSIGEMLQSGFLGKYKLTEETAHPDAVTRTDRTIAKAKADRHTDTEDSMTSMMVQSFIFNPDMLAAAKRAIEIVEADD